MNRGKKYPIKEAVCDMNTYKLAPKPVRLKNIRCTYPMATPYRIETKNEYNGCTAKKTGSEELLV
jgi:hypothetical protein